MARNTVNSCDAVTYPLPRLGSWVRIPSPAPDFNHHELHGLGSPGDQDVAAVTDSLFALLNKARPLLHRSERGRLHPKAPGVARGPRFIPAWQPLGMRVYDRELTGLAAPQWVAPISRNPP